MTNLSDDDMTTERPTEQEDDKDQSGHGTKDTGDAPNESDVDRDAGGEGIEDTGDEF